MYRVALLEDDEWVIKGIEASFNWAKYGMEVVGRFLDPKDMLSYLKTEDVDVIFTDINMPNMDGIEFTKELRKTDGYKFTPIIALTTENQSSKMEEGKAAGATGWIVKPFTSEKLIAIVKKIIG